MLFSGVFCFVLLFRAPTQRHSMAAVAPSGSARERLRALRAESSSNSELVLELAAEVLRQGAGSLGDEGTAFFFFGRLCLALTLADALRTSVVLLRAGFHRNARLSRGGRAAGGTYAAVLCSAPVPCSPLSAQQRCFKALDSKFKGSNRVAILKGMELESKGK